MSLRNGKTRMSPTSGMDSKKHTKPSSLQTAPPRPSPYLLLVYPVILALGSAFSQISPIANSHIKTHGYSAPLTPGLTSDQNTPTDPVQQFNYFAGKRNVLNVYFVKIGWFWTTLAFLALQAVVHTSSKSVNKPSRFIQPFIRYTIATVSWIFVTQWLFGPPLVDRSFTLTGGHCESTTLPHSLPINDETIARINRLPSIASGVACKAAGGHWRGGHDISGHVFLLVLSSVFLIYELLISDTQSAHPHISPSAAKNISHGLSEEERTAVGGWESETVAQLRIWARRFVYVVLGLDFWMLMMTAIWFHTWPEKLSGLLLAGGTAWLVYFLGDFVPAWKSVVGL